MSNTPLTAIGDEAIEARIVAWVLGEASAFEIAELERLCTERPELAIFHRRMRALHGLVGEAVTPRPDPLWKLPPGKRNPLLNLLDPAPPKSRAVDETRIHFSMRRTLLSIAACLVLSAIILGFSAPMFIRQRKKADMTAARSMASQRELAALEEETEQNDRLFALRTELPQELIEGTPKPIVLPQQTPSTEMAKAKAPLSSQAKGVLSSPFSVETSGQPEDALVMQEKKVSPDPERKPSAPGSSMSNPSASVTSGAKIPLPETAANEPTLDFGDGDHFGTGWGKAGQGAGGGGFFKQSVTEGGSHANGTATPGPIDGLLAGAQGGALKNDLSGLRSRDAKGQDAPAEPYGYDSLGEEKSKSLAVRDKKSGESLFLGMNVAGETEAGSVHWFADESERARFNETLRKEESSSDLADKEMIRRQVLTGEAREKLEKQQELLLEAERKPATPQEKPDPASFIEETSAAEEPYSTFSLNISDASFRIRQASRSSSSTMPWTTATPHRAQANRWPAPSNKPPIRSSPAATWCAFP